jgi:hypothetical protein
MSSGRGGAGNIRPSSGTRDDVSHKSGPGPEDYSQSRGRELPAPQAEKVSPSSTGHEVASCLTHLFPVLPLGKSRR